MLRAVSCDHIMFPTTQSQIALPAESSEFHLTLIGAYRAHFSNSKYAKKAGHFKWKAGKRDDAKKA